MVRPLQRINLRRVSRGCVVLCVLSVCAVPHWGSAEPSQPEPTDQVTQDRQLDLKTLSDLEHQQVQLDLLIDQQTDRLVQLHDRLAVETDTARRQQLDGLITRLTTLLDALEEQRSLLDEQTETLRSLLEQTGAGEDT